MEFLLGLLVTNGLISISDIVLKVVKDKKDRQHLISSFESNGYNVKRGLFEFLNNECSIKYVDIETGEIKVESKPTICYLKALIPGYNIVDLLKTESKGSYYMDCNYCSSEVLDRLQDMKYIEKNENFEYIQNEKEQLAKLSKTLLDAEIYLNKHDDIDESDEKYDSCEFENEKIEIFTEEPDDNVDELVEKYDSYKFEIESRQNEQAKIFKAEHYDNISKIVEVRTLLEYFDAAYGHDDGYNCVTKLEVKTNNSNFRALYHHERGRGYDYSGFGFGGGDEWNEIKVCETSVSQVDLERIYSLIKDDEEALKVFKTYLNAANIKYNLMGENDSLESELENIKNFRIVATM